MTLTNLYLLNNPFFFFNDTATTEIYTLSLHDAHPIFPFSGQYEDRQAGRPAVLPQVAQEIESGAVRQMDVEQQAVGWFAPHRRARLAHAVPELFKIGTQHQSDVRLVVHHEEMPRRYGHRRPRGLQQTGNCRAVTAEVEQQRSDVGRRLHQDDQEGVRVEHGNDRQAFAELQHRGVEVAAGAGIAELCHVLDCRWEQCSDIIRVDAVGARIDGQAVAADD